MSRGAPHGQGRLPYRSRVGGACWWPSPDGSGARCPEIFAPLALVFSLRTRGSVALLIAAALKMGLTAMSELAARLDVPLGLAAPGTARRAVRAVLQGWGYHDAEWLDVAAVVTSELITNAVRHGGGCVEFTVESHEGRVVLAVADGSPVAPCRRDPDQAGGRGIAVIEAFSEQWGVHNHEGGKRVWVELPPSPDRHDGQPATAREDTV
jgi:anti-sigma regulatory factor (Ser/Thr protein kinase)